MKRSTDLAVACSLVQLKQQQVAGLISEFDPDDEECTITTWLKTIDQLGDMYGWDDKTKLFYLQDKLRGQASKWYNRRKKYYDFSWSQWKLMLVCEFRKPHEYAGIVEEMFNRKKINYESKTKYYQDKVACACKLSNNEKRVESWREIADETQNIFKTCSSTNRPEVEISGVHSLEVTSDKSKSIDEIKRRTNIYENFSMPDFPSCITHKNDNSKNSLQRRSSLSDMIADMNKLTLDSHLLMEVDSQSGLDETLIMVQNRTNEFLSCDVGGSNRSRSSAISGVSSNPSGSIVLADVHKEYKYKDDILRDELIRLRVTPGPIQNTTRTPNLKKLQANRNRIKPKTNPVVIEHKESVKTYSVELTKSLENGKWSKKLSPYKKLLSKIQREFEHPNRIWREGKAKTSFTYLLLDPRITENLPAKASHQPHQVSWATFISSIFYIGKGKRSRPYSHLYQALTPWKSDIRKSSKQKIQHILDIWSDNLGVICLHVFQNVIPVEAYTYEAAMIDVIGLKNLKNEKVGNYYGVAERDMTRKERHMLGVFLLYKALNIYMHEGERQLRPDNI